MSFGALFFLSAEPAVAQSAVSPDSVEIGLITCSPHEEIYSLYGHSALRYHNLTNGDDVVFNYGIFNFKKPHFILRFVFGLTDYELGISPFDRFCDYYKSWGSEVKEQVLNLTPAEKNNIAAALAANLQPENKIYRYNYFYDNCSTRPRDLVERNIDGVIKYATANDTPMSYRQLVREHVKHHPWAMFGNDMLLGVKADKNITQRESEFLPERLAYDFDRAVVNRGGSCQPLVKETRIHIAHGLQEAEEDFPLTPMQCAFVLLAVSLAVFAVEWHRHLTFKYWDALLMLACGLAGIIIFVMFFSQHPTTSTNLLIFLLNPLPLFFIPAILRRRTKKRLWWTMLAFIALFLIGGIWQSYAEGTYILALCLLIRICSHLRNDK